MDRFLHILKRIVLVLGFFVLVLMVLAFFYKIKSTSLGESQSSVETNSVESTDLTTEKSYKLFGDIGLLRIQTQDGKTLIIEPYFEYSAHDSAFQEELVKKKVDIGARITAFFAIRTSQQIGELEDAQLKTLILELVNEILTLSHIEKMYCDKYMIMD